MKKVILILLIVIASATKQSAAENNTNDSLQYLKKIDSLKTLLKNYNKKRIELGNHPYTILDSVKVNLLNKISGETDDLNFKEIMRYTDEALSISSLTH